MDAKVSSHARLLVTACNGNEYEFALDDSNTLVQRLPEFDGRNDWRATEHPDHDNPRLIEALKRVLRAYDWTRFGPYDEAIKPLSERDDKIVENGGTNE
jgi:hypothetical protein